MIMIKEALYICRYYKLIFLLIDTYFNQLSMINYVNRVIKK